MNCGDGSNILPKNIMHLNKKLNQFKNRRLTQIQ